MSPELLVIGGAFITGLMGGGHCALMCGGIATGFSRIDQTIALTAIASRTAIRARTIFLFMQAVPESNGPRF